QGKAADNQRHQRQPPLDDKADGDGDGGSADEEPCGLNQGLVALKTVQPIDEEGPGEGDQGAEVDGLPDPGGGCCALTHDVGSSPTRDRAKASASKGCRSSIPSPTPISLIGASEAWATGT